MKKIYGALLILVMVVAAQAFAAPVQDTIYTYYSDSSLTTVVGRLYDMCHSRWSTGTTTQWVDIAYGYPCGGGACNSCLTNESIDGAGICDDGIDNDGDGHIDEVDPGCQCLYSCSYEPPVVQDFAALTCSARIAPWRQSYVFNKRAGTFRVEDVFDPGRLFLASALLRKDVMVN